MDKQEAETFRQVAFASLRAVCAPGTTRFWTESSPEVEDLVKKGFLKWEEAIEETGEIVACFTTQLGMFEFLKHQAKREITDTDRINAFYNLLDSDLNTDGEKIVIFQDYPREYYIIKNQGRHFYGKTLREALDNLIEKICGE